MAEIKEECGIAAVYLKRAVSSVIVPHTLIAAGVALQHRGQRSAGISVYNPAFDGQPSRDVLLTFKGMGLVSEVFRTRHITEYNRLVSGLEGVAGIVHTRYATSGSDDPVAATREAQPMVREHPRPFKHFSLALNGNLPDYFELRRMMNEKGYRFNTDVDTELIVNLFASTIKKQTLLEGDEKDKKPDLFEVSRSVMEQLDGSYNLVLIFGDGDLLAIRDKRGRHPLVWGENDEFYAIASESTALEAIGINSYRDVKPGQGLIINGKGAREKQIIEGQLKLCELEPVYFSKSDSRNDGISVHEVRHRLGLELAIIEREKGTLDFSHREKYVVIPQPFTAIPASETYSEELVLRRRDAIEKREGLRGFINSKETREVIMRGYLAHGEDVEGQCVIIVDDSIVRGETVMTTIELLRKKGAREIHLRVTEPPIRFPCFDGIDYPTLSELIVNRASGGRDMPLDELEKVVAKKLEIDSMGFMTLEGLIEAIGLPRDNLCLGCLTGEYPSRVAQERYQQLINGKDKLRI